MSNIQILVERDSVCMGDDVDAPHFYEFTLPANKPLNDVFKHLAKKRYLASVAGKNHSWEAIVNGNAIASFKGNNKQPEIAKILFTEVSNYIENGVVNMRFKYNSSAT